MLKIYVVRHGQNLDNQNNILGGHRDEPLTQKGEEESRLLASRFKELGISFDAVYTSPLVRAQATAEIITDTLKLKKPEVLTDLIERDFGIMEGESVARIPELCAPNILVTPHTTYFLSARGAETLPQVMKRGRKILKSLAQRFSNASILLVTHGDVGKMLYASYYQLEWRDVLGQFHFGNGDALLLMHDASLEESYFFTQPS